MRNKNIYLDYAAATPMDARVLEAMRPYFSDRFYNPSAIYLGGRDAKRSVEQARAEVASWLGARPSEIIFTAGGSEANNLAIRGIMENYPDGNLVVCSIEHESVIKPAELYAHKLLPVKPDGKADLSKLEGLIDENTVMVSLMYANNEIGTLQPLKEAAKTIKRINKLRAAHGNDRPLYLHTDACQAANYLDLHVSRLGVDMMTLNGGKIYGPKQSGALYLRASISLKAQILGGGQEYGWRSGTENVPAIIGFAEALGVAQKMRTDESSRLSELQKEFMKQLETIPGLTLNGDLKSRLPNNVHITIEGQDNERLIMELDEHGVIAAVGSACSASSDEPSHVLSAIGLSIEQARASLRFTMGRETTRADITRAVKTLRSCLQPL